jgi:hypothetical protein
VNIPSAEFLFMITQLRDVPPARESAEVAVKNHQKPTPAVRFEPMNPTATVPKFERWGGFSGQVDHDEFLT